LLNEMTGDDFLRFGSRLAGQYRASGDPAALRSAVSRCYYGVFHVAQALLERLGHHHKGKLDNPHLFVQRCLQHSGESTAQEAGYLLQTLHQHRKNADYDIDTPNYETVRFVEIAIGHAHAIREKLRTCEFEESARTSIATGVTTYWNKLRSGPSLS
jgi:uncharacterized protein (UPF0332 family)